MEKKNHEEIARQEVLDAYFLSRHNMPAEGSTQCNRSTEEIMNELEEMVYLRKEDVIKWLVEHEYHPITELDGSVKWAIWRIPI